MILKSGGLGGAQPFQTVGDRPEQVVEVRVVRNPTNHTLLCLECVTPTGQTSGVQASKYPDIAELQPSGPFLPHLDVRLSLYNRKWNVLNQQTRKEAIHTLDA